MTPDEFIDGLQFIDKALQMSVPKELREDILYPYFQNERPDMWATICMRTAESCKSVKLLTLYSFIDAKAAIIKGEKGSRGESFEQASKRNQEAREARETVRQNALLETHRPMIELAEEQLKKTGNKFYQELVDHLKWEKAKGDTQS